MTIQTPYDANFYEDLASGSVRSAEIILRLIYDKFVPRSVVDFGCGRGAWLSVAERLGAESLTGFDGPWVDRAKLISASINFIPTDFSADIVLKQKFDLAMSVEVAEHLSPKQADWFVDTICRAADVVVFGAAAPGQGGTNHVNEQWPSYWARRFASRGFEAIDVFRQQLWSNESVEWWYRQNTLLYINQNSSLPSALSSLPRVSLDRIDIVHPRMFLLREGQREKLWRSYNQPKLTDCMGVLRNFLATRVKAAIGRGQR